MHTFPVTITVNSSNEKIIMYSSIENIEEMRLEYFKIVNLPVALFPPEFMYIEISSTYNNAEHETNILNNSWTAVTVFPPPPRCFPLRYKLENQGTPAAPGYTNFTLQGKQGKPYYKICNFRRLSDISVKVYGPDCMPLVFGPFTVAQFQFTVKTKSTNLNPEERLTQYNKFHS